MKKVTELFNSSIPKTFESIPKTFGEKNKAFTHAGVFHADDVFSTALLKIIDPSIEIIRGFKVPDDFDGIIFDIGGGMYDHHQEGAEVRENGVPYAAFGLLWRECGEKFLGADGAKELDERLVQLIDKADNGVESNPLSSAIGLFNPNWDEGDWCEEVRFFEAVEMAKGILTRSMKAINSRALAETEVRKAMEESDGEVLILSRYAPWQRYVVGTSYKFVVFPSKRGGYNVQGVPVEEESFELVVPLPEEWRGKPADELPAITGVKDCTFVHPSGFLGSAETLEGAIDMAKLALS